MKAELYPHQAGMVGRHKELLRARGVTIDRSETGVGKTPAILVAAQELGVPVAIVCPKTLKSHWRGWCGLCGVKPVSVVGWEECKLGKIPRLFNPQGVGVKWLQEYPATKILIIFDEAHRSKSKKTLNAQMVAAAKREGHWLALLSATLIQSPLDLLGLAYPLGLVNSQREVGGLARRYGVGINRWGGYADFSIHSQKTALHQELAKIGVRILKRNITSACCLNQADLVDDPTGQVKTMYEVLAAGIAELEAKGHQALELVTKRLHARQAIELAKVPLFVEETLKHLEEGARVTIFLCFTASIEAAARLLAEEGISYGMITGETSLQGRDKATQGYCFGPLRVMLCNIAAAGEGISLHDQDGRYPRVGLLSIPESSVHLIQALGRNDRVGSKSVGLNRILFCADSMEQEVYENVVRKIRDIERINDGDLQILSKALSGKTS